MTEIIKSNEDIFSQKIAEFEASHTYPPKAIELVKASQKYLNPILNSWDAAFSKVLSAFGISDCKQNDMPLLLQQITLRKISQESTQDGPKIIGIAGPGACGKGTLIDALNLPKVINTTTRTPRCYEIDQVDYRFVDDSSFQEMIKAGGFLTTDYKPGRGWYGIEKDSLHSVLKQSLAVIIEGNPSTLFDIQRSIVNKNAYFTINYILPPYPPIPHLATRLAKRSIETNSDFVSSIESTLGERQITEFESLIDISRKGGNICFFVVDNNVDQVASSIKRIWHIDN